MWKVWERRGIQLFGWERLARCELLLGVSVSRRSFNLRNSVPCGLKIQRRGRLKGDVVQEMVRKVKEILLLANSSVFLHLLESLHGCWDGVKGGGAERRVCFDCSLRSHVVLGPLKVAAWFCVLRYLR